MAHFEIFEGAKKPEDLEQVDHHDDHHNSIQNTLNLAVHRDVRIHKPEEHSDNNQNTDEINERHRIVLLTIRPAETPIGTKRFHHDRMTDVAEHSPPLTVDRFASFRGNSRTLQTAHSLARQAPKAEMMQRSDQYTSPSINDRRLYRIDHGVCFGEGDSCQELRVKMKGDIPEPGGTTEPVRNGLSQHTAIPRWTMEYELTRRVQIA